MNQETVKTEKGTSENGEHGEREKEGETESEIEEREREQHNVAEGKQNGDKQTKHLLTFPETMTYAKIRSKLSIKCRITTPTHLSHGAPDLENYVTSKNNMRLLKYPSQIKVVFYNKRTVEFFQP